MFRTFLSWRYLVARRTNLIGIVGLFLGVGVPILILSIMSGFLEDQREILRGDLADVVVEPFFSERPDGVDVARAPAPLLGLARADERVAHATARLSWYGILSQGGDAADVSQMLLSGDGGHFSAVELVGVEAQVPEKLALLTLSTWLHALGAPLAPRLEGEFDATDLLDSLVREPSWGARVENPLVPFLPPPNYRPRGRVKASVVVGDLLFRHQELRRGSILHVSTAVPDPVTGELVPATREFVVAGTFRTGNRELDLGRIYLEREELADFLGDGREFSEVLVQLANYGSDATDFCRDFEASAAAAGLLAGDGAHEVQTWEQHRGAILGAIRNERVMMGVMLSLVLVVAGFTLFAILSMLVTEKRRDIGILTAIGATPRGIMATFLMIGMWDALIGATLGAAAGVWASVEIASLESWLANTFGIQIFDHSIFAFDHIPSRVEPLGVALMVLMAFACALVFASIPAWRAAKLDPLEALRYE